MNPIYASRRRNDIIIRKSGAEPIRLKLQGKSFPEIQKIMGVAAVNTVYTWDHRCRKSLLELMGGDWEQGRK